MRKFIILLACLMACGHLYSQVSVNNDGSPPHGSAMFEIKSNSKGFLPPRMTWPQIKAIQNPAAGLVVYDEGLKALRMYDGTRWIVIGPKEYELTDPSRQLQQFYKFKNLFFQRRTDCNGNEQTNKPPGILS